MQMWDLGSGELMHNINWGPKVDGEATLLYAAQFSRDNARRVIAGGSGTNEARLFDRASGELLGSLREPNMGPVFSVDFAPTAQQCAVGTSDGFIRVVNLL